jgi:hypothetical protein
VSAVDRGRPAPRNVLAVVDVTSCGLYQLGTKEGLLERLCDLNEFTTADNNFIKFTIFSVSLGDNVWK